MESLKNRSIGIFDSGVGGLTVAKSVRKLLPHEDIIYFGDTARVPYGNKSKATITRFAHQIMFFLMEKRVKLVVVACNTASSLSLGSLKRHYRVPVTGVIGPGVREAVRLSKNGRVGVIGTSSTVSSKAYDRELAKAKGSYRLFGKSCPLFVPLVENGFTSDPVTYKVARKYLKEFKAKRIDTLILGCTHYPLLKGVIAKVMGNVRLVDSSLAVAREVKGMLGDKGLDACRGRRPGTIRCYVSDDAEGFRKTAGMFLKEKIDVKKVTL